MKTIVTVFLFFLVFAPSSFGQVEPRLYHKIYFFDDSSSDRFIKYGDIFYEYDALGKISKRTIKTYSREGVLDKWKGVFYLYNSQDQVLKETTRKYNSDLNLWVTESWDEYEYDLNGCEISFKHFENIGGLFNEYLYERNADCQITKETYSERFTIIDSLELRHIYERDYFSDGISYRVTWYEPQLFLNNELTIDKISDTYLHPNGELDEVYTTFNDNLGNYKYDAKYLYEYDQFDNLTSNYIYRKDDIVTDWVLQYHYQYENEYDEEQRLIKVSIALMDYTFDPPSYVEGGRNEFEYWCKDLEKANIISYGDDFLIYRFESYYEGINECFDIENKLLEMDVFPNPTSGLVTINSSILESGDTQISVFDMNGRLLLEKNESRRGALMEFDLGNLPNGMYVVQLMNQEHFVHSKVLINK